MKYLLLISMLFTGLSFAQTTTDKIFDNLDDIYKILPRTNASEFQLVNINEKLLEIKRSLRGGQNTFKNLGCASRDNDNRSPWSVVYTRSDLSKVKYRSINFKSLDDCEKSIEVTQTISAQTFFCASRDKDGRTPITIWVVNNLDAKVRRDIIFSSLDQCLSSLSLARKTFSSISLCASRDKDGGSPFSTWLLNTINTQRDRSSSYASLESCIRAN
jgi:hypothetical protein